MRACSALPILSNFKLIKNYGDYKLQIQNKNLLLHCELSKVKQTMIDKIKSLLQEVENLTASNAEELEALRIKYIVKIG